MPSLNRNISLVDTTIRDGQQAPGLAFSLDTRTLLIEALDQIGLARIEAIYPGMSIRENRAAKRWPEIATRAKIVAWNRLNVGDVKASMALKPGVIHVGFPVSESHMERKIMATFDKAAATLETCLDMARVSGFEVSVGLEDASRASYQRLIQARSLMLYLQAGRVRLSDTVGILTPASTKRLVEFFVAGGLKVEFHAHNDLGMATANSLMAAQSGADSIDVTLLGIGERAGNASLSAFVALAEKTPGLSLDVTLEQASKIEDAFKKFLNRDEYLGTLSNSSGSDITDWVDHHGCRD
ncbi:MAG: homocitrate synthase [Deltaproteobacteria bacterium]|jgi:homocitrate synthase NifV|nr:homocitrate synthase [Deltaproteobacteria bacterium]